MEVQFDELVNLLLRDVGQVFLQIYQLYFPHEIRATQIPDTKDDILKNSQKSMFEFYKDFEISPGLISKSVAYKIFVQAKDKSVQNDDVLAIYTPTGLDIIKSMLLSTKN